jgi:LPXTG-motif cell wall-anchored protein
VFWEGQTPLLGDVSFVDAAISKMDEWLTVVEADHRSVPLAQKIVDAKAKAGVVPRCVAPGGADVPLEVCDTTVDPTIFSSPRIEAGGGDPVVGFTDDRLDCQTVPLETFDYAGQSFAEVFTPAQQATLKKTYPTGVCDYSKPGKGFQAATTWLTYQDAAGKVVYGGTPLGAAPVSVPFRGRSAAAGTPASTGGVSVAGGSLPTTGASGAAALAGLALLAGAGVLARRRSVARG